MTDLKTDWLCLKKTKSCFSKAPKFCRSRTPSLRFSGAVKLILVASLLASSLMPASVAAQNRFRERIQQRIAQKQSNSPYPEPLKEQISNLQVAVWPAQNTSEPAPLIVFSHGFHGKNTQSQSLMNALASAGYMVFAPNHKDAMGGGTSLKPDISFQTPEKWTDSTYSARQHDIAALLMGLRANEKWSKKIDWNKVGYIGHSLGGYTVLGLAGAWPSWKRIDVKAVIALSPYSQPFLAHGSLETIGIPVMYQGGSRDRPLTPAIKQSGGTFSRTSSPAYFVEFDNAGHLAWTNFNKDPLVNKLINHYSVAFLDKYLKGDSVADPAMKLDGVVQLDVK